MFSTHDALQNKYVCYVDVWHIHKNSYSRSKEAQLSFFLYNKQHFGEKKVNSLRILAFFE